MEILSGLFDHAVLQRTAHNICDTPVELKSPPAGEVYVRMGKSWKHMGRAPRFRLTGLRTGGPYTVAIQIRQAGKVVEQLIVKDVLVGDVWIAAGQSNMQGCGRREFADKPQSQVRAFYMDDQWRVARDPIHNMWDCVDQVHMDLAGGVRPGVNKTQGVGPAVAFAQEMRRLTGVPQGVIACAHGGTTMTQWNPQRRDELGKSLYGATYRRLLKNGRRVAGVIWYQGESDANKADAAVYTKRMQELIAAFRRDAQAPQLPFVLVQISRVVGWGSDVDSPWNTIQDQQRLLPRLIRNVATVPAIDLTLDDQIHIGGRSNTRLGIRLAQAMHHLTTGKGKAPIMFRKAKLDVDRVTGLAKLIVEFDNVHGQLRNAGRPTGLTTVPANFFDTQVAGNRVILRLTTPLSGSQGLLLQYGRGTNPFCNITDEADRSLPVFGPIRIGPGRATTGFVRQIQVTDLLNGAGKLNELKYPESVTGLPWRPLEAVNEFCSVHTQIAPTAPEDKLVYFRCELDVPEPMKLAVMLGYDGPVKLWVNGRELFHDPHGTNPAVIDAKKITFTGTPGRHEILVALGTNQGLAWGIFLRFERLDVSRKLIAMGPMHYALPEIVSSQG